MKPDLDAILPRVSAEDEATVDALLAKAREGTGKRFIGSRPDLDAIRARLWSTSTTASTFADDVAALLAYIDELERRTTYTTGEAEWAQRIAVAEQRFVDEYDARKAAEREIAELKARITTLEAMKP